MDKKEFKGLNADQRANYINEKMLCGDSFNKVCQELKISTSQYTYLEKHGYKLDKEKNQFVKQQIEGQQSLIETLKDNLNADVEKHLKGEPQEGEKVLNDMKAPIKEEVVTKPQEVEKQMSNTIASKEVKFIKTEGEKGQRITFEVDKKIIQALRFKKVAENSKGFIINNYIEQLLLDNIEKKYFDMVDK